VGSVDEVIARIRGELLIAGLRGRRRGGPELLLDQGWGRDDENSTAYYAYVDGERYVLSKTRTYY
jgi:hypothetical protein